MYTNQYQLLNNTIQMGNCMPETKNKRNGRKTHIQPHHASFSRPQESWQSCLRICDISIEPQYYNNSQIKHPCFEQIAKDRDRTYPFEPYFAIAQNKIKLESLLRRTAIYFPKLGYTQGINFVAGQLLLYGMSEQQAYKSLIRMFVHPRLLFIGLYEDHFPLVKIYCELFWKLVEAAMPETVLKIRSLIISDDMWIFQWFLSFFALSFPKEYIKEMITFILNEKEFAAVRIAVAVMMVLRDTLESFQEAFEDEFITCIERLKDIKYAVQVVPLDSILSEAKKISPSLIYAILPSIECNNWYKHYFAMPQTVRVESYNVFLLQKIQERQGFLMVNRGDSCKVGYEREQISVQVIDEIEEKKLKRFGRCMSLSVKEKSIYRSFVVHGNWSVCHLPRQSQSSPRELEMPVKTTLVQSVFYDILI